MPDNVTNSSVIEPAVGIFYERVLLQPNFPKYIHNRFAQKSSIPSKNGSTVKWRRYARYAAATTPLVDGITPNGHKQSKVDLLATASQFGDFAIITDVVDLTNEDPNITIEVDRQGDQMQNTMDVITRDILVNSASRITCSNGNPVGTLLNAVDIKTARQALRSGDAEHLTQLVRGGTGQGTSPIRASFFAMADTDLEDDLDVVSGFKHVANYAGQQGVDVSEYGATDGVRWLTTTQGATSGSNYLIPIVGKNAYGVVDINGGTAKSIIKGFGSGGTVDPLDQRATVGWKMWQVARILNDANIIVLVCTNG